MNAICYGIGILIILAGAYYFLYALMSVAASADRHIEDMLENEKREAKQ
jgi:hypothetical protein